MIRAIKKWSERKNEKGDSFNVNLSVPSVVTYLRINIEKLDRFAYMVNIFSFAMYNL